MTLQIPADLFPLTDDSAAGRRKMHGAQVAALSDAAGALLGTSHRQAPVKNLVGSVRERLAELFRLPDGYRHTSSATADPRRSGTRPRSG